MKRFPLLFVSTILLLGLACKKEEVELPDISGFAPEDCRVAETYINEELFEEFLYDGTGRLERYNRYDNDAIYEFITFEYDGQGRLSEYFYNFNSFDTVGLIYHYTFEYDSAGRAVNSAQYQLDYQGDPTEDLRLSFEYTYDQEGQLTELIVLQTADTSTVLSQEFEYDERGNTSRVDFLENDELRSWIEYAYDDQPNQYSFHFELLTNLFQKNNQVLNKRTRFQPMSTNTIVDNLLFEYEYYGNGLIKVQTSNTSSEEKKYKYDCQ